MGNLGGDYWNGHGQHFIGKNVQWECSLTSIEDVKMDFNYNSHYGEKSTQERLKMIKKLLSGIPSPLKDKIFFREPSKNDKSKGY